MVLSKTFDIKLSLEKKELNDTFAINNNDLNSVKLRMLLYQGGLRLNLAGKTAKIVIKKPDARIVYQDCSVTDATNGVVEVTLSTQSTLVPGKHDVELMVYEGSEIVAVTGKFNYLVNKALLNDETVESTNEFTTFTQIVTDAESARMEAQQSASDAAASATQAQTTINDAKGTYPSLRDRLNNTDSLMAEIAYNVKTFGAKGDGTTDDSIAIQSADSLDGVLLFPKGTYISTFIPNSLCKGSGATLIINGYYINLDDKALPVNSVWQTYTRLNNTILGLDAGRKFTATSYGNTAVGDKALQNNSSSVRNTAVGNDALQEMEDGYGNTAVGIDSLHWSYYSDRNTMIGSTAGKNIGNKNIVERHEYFKTGGDTSILDTYWPEWRTYAGTIAAPNFVPVSRDDTTSNVGVGRNSLGFAVTPKRNVAIGYNALEGGLNADTCTVVGESAAQFALKSTYSTIVGGRAGFHLMDTNQDVFIGKSAAQELVHSSQNIGVGYQAMAGLQITNKADLPTNNVAIGRISMANAKGSYAGNVGIGGSSLIVNEGNNNTAIGTNSAGFNKTGSNVTAVGYNALNNAAITGYNNVTGLGANATVTGDNQVQLGSSSTTAYAYGTVQNRSDERDKTDIQDTVLGLDFINRLRPVDFKWDYREDYFAEVEEITTYISVDENGNETKTEIPLIKRIPLPKDGCKKRSRYHHGLIAQEVKEVIDETGIDFGGYQDHSVNGGQDVLSIGYDELISPLIKAVQELTARVKELESIL